MQDPNGLSGAERGRRSEGANPCVTRERRRAVVEDQSAQVARLPHSHLSSHAGLSVLDGYEIGKIMPAYSHSIRAQASALSYSVVPVAGGIPRAPARGCERSGRWRAAYPTRRQPYAADARRGYDGEGP